MKKTFVNIEPYQGPFEVVAIMGDVIWVNLSFAEKIPSWSGVAIEDLSLYEDVKEIIIEHYGGEQYIQRDRFGQTKLSQVKFLDSNSNDKFLFQLMLRELEKEIK